MINCTDTLIFVTTIFIILNGGYLQECNFKVHNKQRQRNPLILRNYSTHFEFVIPQKGLIKLNSGEKINLACTDTGNYITATHSKLNYGKCIENNILRIGRVDMEFEEIVCNKRIKGEINATNKSCGRGQGQIINIGYFINGKFVTLITVCYDNSKGRTLYTEHLLYGKEIKYASRDVTRPGFSTSGFDSIIQTNNVYKKTEQKSTFKKLLGSDRLAQKYINDNYSFLAKGHLTPHADFIYTTFQGTSYYYLNTCPQWQIINGGNWKSVEASIRKIAEKYDETFTIVTGTHGILSLNDVNNQPKEIFLSGDKLPVPKYVWKIVYNDNLREGIALIVLNNPFLDNVMQSDILCNNICTKYGWGSSRWNNAARGYVQCCDLNSFADIVTSAPNFYVNSVLPGILDT